jgi:hypothetical protein
MRAGNEIDSIDRISDCYKQLFVMKAITFGTGRRPISPLIKRNLHEAGKEFEPKAQRRAAASPCLPG